MYIPDAPVSAFAVGFMLGWGVVLRLLLYVVE